MADLPLDILERIAKLCPPSVNVCLASRAFRAGRTARTRACLDYTVEGLYAEARRPELDAATQRRCRRWVIHAAARRGDVSFLGAAARDDEFAIQDVALTAARYGCVETLQWAHRAGYRFTAADSAAAAKSGHMAALRWILDHASAAMQEPAITLYACLNNCPIMLEYALSRGCRVHPDAATAACAHVNLPLVERVAAAGGPLRAAGCNILLQKGSLADVQAWVAAGGEWHRDATVICVTLGRLDVLRWAVERGACPWSPKTWEYLVNTGDVDLLQWAIARSCPLPEYAADFADLRGRPGVAAWIRGLTTAGRERARP